MYQIQRKINNKNNKNFKKNSNMNLETINFKQQIMHIQIILTSIKKKSKF